MMESLSPFTRRVVALGLLVVVMISALNLIVLPLGLLFRQSLAQLGDTRFQRSQLEAIIARPSPNSGDPVPAARYIAAASKPAAIGQLEARIRADAATTKVRLSSLNALPDAPGNPHRLSVALAAEGDEVALVNFLGRIEQAPPLLRAGRWRITHAANGGPIHLDAQIDAAWGFNR